MFTLSATASRSFYSWAASVIPDMELLFSLAEAAAAGEAPRNGGGVPGTGSAWQSPSPRPPCCCCCCCPRVQLISPGAPRYPQPPPGRASACPWCRGRGRTWCTSHCRSCAPQAPRTTGPAIKVFISKNIHLDKNDEEIRHSFARPIIAIWVPALCRWLGPGHVLLARTRTRWQNIHWSRRHSCRHCWWSRRCCSLQTMSRVRGRNTCCVLQVVSHLNCGLNSRLIRDNNATQEEFSRYQEFYSIYNACKTELEWVKIAMPTSS